MAKPTVFVTRNIPTPGVALVREFCDVFLHGGEAPPSREELIQKVKDKDALICLLTDRIDKDVIGAGKNLKVISTMSVGFEHIDVLEATKNGIYVGYTPDVLTDATADLTFTLLLCSARRIVEADSYVRRGDWKIPWSPTLFIGEDVWGRTIGIIGLGRIGKAVAKRAKGFDMRILYTGRRRSTPSQEDELGAEYRSLEDLLKESDFVTLHVPLTKETYHMINENNLRLMKPTARLINTSRGATIDEKALIRALDEKWTNQQLVYHYLEQEGIYVE